METAVLTVLLLVGAYLMAASIVLAGHAWLRWFALLPLFIVIRFWRPAGTLLAGALWGVSLQIFLVGKPEAAAATTVPFVMGLAAIPAIYAYLASGLTRWMGFNPFVLGVGWMGAEFAFGLLGVRGGVLGGGQGEGTFLHWVASALGYVVAAFLVAFVNASLVWLLHDARLRIPRQRCVTRSDGRESRLLAQVLSFFPVSAVGPLQPRAPPRRPATP